MGVLGKIRSIISKELALDEAKIKENSRLVEDLDADSLNKFSILAAVGEEFNIELDADATMEIETVQDIVKMVKGSID